MSPVPPQSRRVLITGVSRGLGRAMTERFIELGHLVAGCCRSADAVEELRGRHGPPHRFDQCDVALDHQVALWAREVLGHWGTPELVLNNAALINRNAPLWQVPTAEFDAVIDVNVKGTANVLRHFLPALVAARRGVVANFSSGWGRSTSPKVAPYCATKWAIEGLSQAVAQEVPRGLAVVPLNPGIIDTDMLQSCFGHSAGDYPSPQAWARTAVDFLLSLGPEHNGQSLDVPEAGS